MALRRTLLVCGVLSSLLYLGIDQLAAVRFGDYHSFSSQTISELGARGAPTKSLVDPLYVVYGLLAIAFGIGAWMSAEGNRALRVTAVLLIVYGAVGLPGPFLFPMNLRGVGGDVSHIVMTAVIVAIILATVLAGAFAFGHRFRLYSFATIVTSIVFGTLTSVQAKGLVTGEPTPLIGIAERICIGAFLAWVAVLALILLRATRRERTPVVTLSRRRQVFA
jgi:Protein of unknown function (DUF998)